MIEPIVFLHGFLGTGQDWMRVCSFLADFPCVAVDLPGHGNAPFREVFELDVDFERFVLVGYSMGGRLAMEYAAKHPERVSSLILISAHPGLLSEDEKQKRLANDAEWAKLLLELPIDEFLSRWYDQPLFHPFKPDLSAMSIRKRQNPESLAKALVQFSLGKQPRYDTKDALVLVGESDEKFRKLHPHANIIAGAGHMAHLENPRAVAEAIKKRMTPL
jgi:2-succinyl-6-hydroxy-2,4-cyclohexadiene-1-carboxylate synthase